jgi:hypothetical protein
MVEDKRKLDQILNEISAINATIDKGREVYGARLDELERLVKLETSDKNPDAEVKPRVAAVKLSNSGGQGNS